MKLYRDEEDKAFEVAAELMLMSSSRDSEDPCYLQHAYEAVRVFDDQYRPIVDNAAFPHKLYAHAVGLKNEAIARAVANRLAAEEADQAMMEGDEVGVVAEEEGIGMEGGSLSADGGESMDVEKGEDIGQTGVPGSDDPGVQALREPLRSGSALKSGALGGAKTGGALPTPGSSKAASRMHTNDSTGQPAKPSRLRPGLAVSTSGDAPPGPTTAMGTESGRFNIGAAPESPTEQTGVQSMQQTTSSPPVRSNSGDCDDQKVLKDTG